MMDKYKAITYGSTALDYILREGKLGSQLVFHNLCSKGSKTIYKKMKMVSDYNNRCGNRFLRIETGITPQDEKRLPVSELIWITHLFTKRMELDSHQWAVVAHKDTDNRHIHITANHISPYGEVYDTTFVSNRAAKVVEEVSREKGLVIAEEVKTEKKYQKTKASPVREQARKEVQQVCYSLLDRYRGTGVTGHFTFLHKLNKKGIIIERTKNKQGKVYGLEFLYTGQPFKASEIGREFGYRSLQGNSKPVSKEGPKKPRQTVQEPTENNK